MFNHASREVRLVSRPKGLPTAENFTIAERKREPLQHRQMLVRNLFMSVDPYTDQWGQPSPLGLNRDI
jgi:NADPH-dependent curcumin reductase CurA